MSPQAASGCAGGLPSAYLDWVIARGGYMADEASSPYHPHHLNFTCPSTGQPNCHCPDVADDHPGVSPHTSHQPPGGAGGAGGGPRRGGGDSPGAGLPPWSRAGATSPLAASCSQVAVSAVDDIFLHYSGGILQVPPGVLHPVSLLSPAGLLGGAGDDPRSGAGGVGQVRLAPRHLHHPYQGRCHRHRLLGGEEQLGQELGGGGLPEDQAGHQGVRHRGHGALQPLPHPPLVHPHLTLPRWWQ